MKIILTEQERDYILSLLKAEDVKIKNKLLKVKRERKSNVYKKCERIKKENFEKLEEIIRGNFNLTNEEIFQKLGISKATFYDIYASEARRLKKIYKSQSLF